jgi:hypothetical protein
VVNVTPARPWPDETRRCPLDKPREIEAKVGRIRTAARETYDRRALTALPSATGVGRRPRRPTPGG